MIKFCTLLSSPFILTATKCSSSGQVSQVSQASKACQPSQSQNFIETITNFISHLLSMIPPSFFDTLKTLLFAAFIAFALYTLLDRL